MENSQNKKIELKNAKGVIYTNTAIGFEKLNEDILKTQKEELLAIFSGNNSKEASNEGTAQKSKG